MGEKGVSDGEFVHSLLRMMTGCYGFHLEQRGLRFWSLAGQVGGPVVHQQTSALEQVGAPIGRLGLPYPLR